MKKIIVMFIAIFVFLAMDVCAEVKKGDWLVGIYSDLGFLKNITKYNNGNKEEGNRFNVDLTAEKFITDNISLGGMAGYWKDSGDWNDEIYYYGISSSYFFQPAKSLNPFINISIGKSDEGSFGKTLMTSGSFGAAYFLNKNVSINGAFKFINYNMSNSEIDKLQRYLINFGFGIKL
jgi:hypothetical protein